MGWEWEQSYLKGACGTIRIEALFVTVVACIILVRYRGE